MTLETIRTKRRGVRAQRPAWLAVVLFCASWLGAPFASAEPTAVPLRSFRVRPAKSGLQLQPIAKSSGPLVAQFTRAPKKRAMAVAEAELLLPPGIDHADLARAQLAVEVVRLGFASSKQILKPKWRKRNAELGIDSVGFCSAAADAIYHLLGGKQGGLTPVVFKSAPDESHWWLRLGAKGQPALLVDATGDQFGEELVAYENGRGTGFQTPYKDQHGRQLPSKGAQELLHKAFAELERRGFSGPKPTLEDVSSFQWLKKGVSETQVLEALAAGER
jgi:hypothetical protein